MAESRALVKAGEQRALVSVLERRCILAMRVFAFSAGVGFMGLAAVDAMFSLFPGSEAFFGATGFALMGLGISKKAPKKEEIG